MMRRIRFRSRSAGGNPRGPTGKSPIRYVNYGPGIAGTPGDLPRGRVFRLSPGVPGMNKGFQRPRHPMNYTSVGPFWRQQTTHFNN
jgi:hypothetical protein